MTPDTQRALRLFISFASKDRELKDEILLHLGVLVRLGKVETWSVDDVHPGDDWLIRVESALEQADVALILLSADLLASEFVHNVEVPQIFRRRALRGLHVVPVLLRTCPWHFHPWIAKLKPFSMNNRAVAAYLGDERDQALTALVSEIARNIALAEAKRTPAHAESVPTSKRDPDNSARHASKKRSEPMYPLHLIVLTDDSASMVDTRGERVVGVLREFMDKLMVLTGGKRRYFQFSLISYGSNASIVCEYLSVNDIDISPYRLDGSSGTAALHTALDAATEVLQRTPTNDLCPPFLFLFVGVMPDDLGAVLKRVEMIKRMNLPCGAPQIIVADFGEPPNNALSGIASNRAMYLPNPKADDLFVLLFSTWSRMLSKPTMASRFGQ